MTDRGSRVLVIVNPEAGRRRGVRLVPQVRAAFEDRGVAVRVEHTEASGHATQLVRRRAGDERLIVLIGGDGTLREAVEGIAAAPPGLEFALIPLGNANVLARELGIPLRPGRAVSAALDAPARRIDVGRIGKRRFLCMVGVGFDALVAERVDRDRRASPTYARWPDAAYLAAAARCIRRKDPPLVTLRAGERSFLGSDLVVTNTRTYAKGWSVAPAAVVDDGKLDFVVRRDERAVDTLVATLRAMWRLPMPAGKGHCGRATEVILESDRPFPYHVDGDPQQSVRRLEVGILPGFLALRAPPTG